MKKLMVSSKSNPNSVAGAVVSFIKENDEVSIQVIGAGALNQAVKAIAIARGYAAPLGIDLNCVPTFAQININNERVTGINLLVKKN